jgi:hypothetical protein
MSKLPFAPLLVPALAPLLVLAFCAPGALAQVPASAAPAPAAASAPAAPMLRLRGTVESVDAASMTLKERSGETIVLVFASNFSVSEVVPIELAAIKPGSYIGTAAMPQPDGTATALEVLVFPEAARGTGEGSFAWDLQPGSTMTNATVADLVATPQGRTLKLRYKDGEKTVAVPPGVPVVTFAPADRTLIMPGARVVITAQLRDGKPTALRALAGRNGFAPPM